MTTELLRTEPPPPADAWDLLRWKETRLRRRLLRGEWRPDLELRVKAELGDIRSEAIGTVDLSSNIFGQTAGQLACLYDRPLRVVHDDVAAAKRVAELLHRSGHGPLMQRGQRDCIGLRELLMRVDVTGPRDAPRIIERPVYPDYVIAEAHPEEPDVPVLIREAIQRRMPGEPSLVWTWDEVDVRDPKRPSYRVLSADLRDDLSPLFLFDHQGRKAPPGGLVGDRYPALDNEGHGVSLYTLYHAAHTAQLWDPFFGIELVEGTLQAGVLWTLFVHGVRHASWPQRYAIDVELPGDTTPAGRIAIVADASTILPLRSLEDSERQPMVGQWQPGADPEVLFSAVSQYERRVASFAGVDASDFVRMSGDPRSGYALSISREGKREMAKKFEPSFMRGDEHHFRVVAALVNGRTRTRTLPTDGYTVEYTSLPPTQDELDAEQRRQIELLDRGLTTRRKAYMRLHGVTADVADRELAEIAAAEEVAGGSTEDVAKLALTGIQTDKILVSGELVGRGVLTKEFAIEAMSIALPFVAPERIQRLFSTVVEGSVRDAAPTGQPPRVRPERADDAGDDTDTSDTEDDG